MNKLKHWWWAQRPTREQLYGLSASQLKTRLKRAGFDVSRDFYKHYGVVRRRGQLFRLRWWAEQGFLVDMCRSEAEFDRWANSTDEVFTFAEFKEAFL